MRCTNRDFNRILTEFFLQLTRHPLNTLLVYRESLHALFASFATIFKFKKQLTAYNTNRTKVRIHTSSHTGNFLMKLWQPVSCLNGCECVHHLVTTGRKRFLEARWRGLCISLRNSDMRWSCTSACRWSWPRRSDILSICPGNVWNTVIET